jgi:hypothetical protein
MRSKYQKTVALSVVMILSITALLSFSPPRVRFVEIEEDSLVRTVNNRVVFHLNQQVELVQKSQIGISPMVDYTTRTEGDMVTIDFSEPLKSDTEYRIKIQDVTSKINGDRTTVDRVFKTSRLQVAYIQRGNVSSDLGYVDVKMPDRVVLASIDGTLATEIFQADKIDQIVAVGDRLAATTVDEDSTHQVVLIDKSGNHEQLVLPMNSRLSDLKASKDGSILGFRFADNPSTNPKLAVYNLLEDSFFYPLSAGGEEFSVVDWALSNDGSVLALQDDDSNVWLSNMSVEEPLVYVGKYTLINGFSGDSRSLLLSNERSTSVYKLQDGTTEKLEIEDAESYPEIRAFEGSDGYFVQRIAYIDAEDEFLSTLSKAESGAEEKILLRSNTLTTTVLGYILSPNDQYVAVELSDMTSALFDDYPTLRRPTNTIIRMIDTFSGDDIAEIRGVSPVIF